MPKRQWKIRRALIPKPEGQLCWDKAYQVLLQLSLTNKVELADLLQPLNHTSELEVKYENSDLCTSVYPTPDSVTND